VVSKTIGKEVAGAQESKKDDTQEKLMEIRAEIDRVFGVEKKSELIHPSSPSRQLDLASREEDSLDASSGKAVVGTLATKDKSLNARGKSAISFGRVWREAFENKRNKVA
jgi:hypothetical protein